ncbi:hypothetical protein AGOR_G00129440 [Albula goreensis]|uniref:Uncharacterized protein n=1 Tax=Albula goreensis TaxID=1534307 RepID=A0A8T3DI12_9TELE|nr:hypothetical protein AGOR_G00129440 [Albula goreensis]
MQGDSKKTAEKTKAESHSLTLLCCGWHICTSCICCSELPLPFHHTDSVRPPHSDKEWQHVIQYAGLSGSS